MKFLSVYLLLSFFTLGFVNSKDIDEEGFVPVKGASLYYKMTGTGEPIVLLHGGPGLDHSYFLPQMEILSGNHRLIYFDQRASGRSSVDVDTSSITIDQFVDDLEALRIYFKLDKMNLMGHSFGGLLAMRYAIKYPDHLKSILLVNSTPASSTWRDSSFAMMSRRSDPATEAKTMALMQTDAFKKRVPDTMAVFFHLLFKNNFYDPAKADEFSLHFQNNYAASSKMASHLNKDSTLISYNLFPELKKLKIPALIIGSEADIVSPLSVEELHSSLKGSEYIFIESCGHFPFIEQPELFLKAVNRFFGKL